MNGRTGQDVDELQRIANILNPASVIPLVLAPVGRLFDAQRRVTRAWELGWPQHWRGPCHNIHDGPNEALPRQIVAAGRRSGHSSRLPLREPILAAIVMTQRARRGSCSRGLARSACLLTTQRTRAQSRPSRRRSPSSRGVQNNAALVRALIKAWTGTANWCARSV